MTAFGFSGSLVFERSTDFGRTWTEIDPHLRSPLVAELAKLTEFEVFDDGFGDLYRWRLRR